MYLTLFLSAFITVNSAHATNHLLRVNEVMAGLNGDSSIQFIEIVVSDDGQKLWGPQNSESEGRAMLEFFDASDNSVGTFIFPSDPPAGEETVLIVSPGFNNAFSSAITPDFILPSAPLVSGTGKVCFKSNPNNNIFPINLCFSYGGFTGNVEGGGTANSTALPTLGSQSFSRFQNFSAQSQINSDFQLATPTPSSTQVTVIDPTHHTNLEQNVVGEISLISIISAATLEYGQGDATTVIDSNLSLAGQTMSGATVTLSGGTPAEDVLTATAAGSISVSFNAASSVLTLSGSGTTVLRSVSYENSNLASIDLNSRTVTFSVTDSLSATANATASINLTPIPAAISTSDTLNYGQGDAATVISSGLALTGQLFNSATVTLTGGDVSEDVLTATAAGSISVSFNAASSVLTLSGSGTL